MNPRKLINLRKVAIVAVSAALIATVVSLGAAGAHTRSARAKPNILLVHGVWADGSSWSGVIQRLQTDGYNVVASQIPLTSFADDVAVVQRDLRVLAGPTLVVGHSYGGQVITQATENMPNVVGVVYIAALAPDTGESVVDQSKLAPALPSEQDAIPIDLPHTGENGAPFIILKRDRFRADFCQDCSAAQAGVMAATETPFNASDFAAPLTGTPAWKQVPAWYQISTADRIINPVLEAILAKRMDPTGHHTIRIASSHASMVTHPQQVASFIERAARGS
jgi:pimeloyl-ACP methyl ester carboxylesterase